MKKIIKLSGVSVANDALPRVNASEGERMLAGIPGLFAWLQAGGRYQHNASEWRDRAHGVVFGTEAEAETLWQLSEFTTGGRPALKGPDASAANYRPPEGVEFDKTRWSIAFVIEMPSSMESTNNGFIGLPRTSVEGDISVRISFTASNNFRLYGPTSLQHRLEYLGPEASNKPALYVLTFSTEQGLTLRVNGDTKVRLADDVRPLTDGAFQIGQSTHLPNHSNTFAGKLGHFLAFNSDLSAPENAGYRSALESTLMDFYGIS